MSNRVQCGNRSTTRLGASSYLTQMLALTVQNFVSAALGMAVLIALIRGLARQSAQTIGISHLAILLESLGLPHARHALYPAAAVVHSRARVRRAAFEGDSPRKYTGLSVTKDPGVWVVWIGCGLMIFGLIVSFFELRR